MKRLCDVSSKYGAPMGRSSYGQPKDGEKCELFQVRMTADGCYDEGGAYWGQGAPLFCLRFEDGERFMRASDRASAFDAFQKSISAKFRLYRPVIRHVSAIHPLDACNWN